jgi:nucleoid DNA-binding protein
MRLVAGFAGSAGSSFRRCQAAVGCPQFLWPRLGNKRIFHLAIRLWDGRQSGKRILDGADCPMIHQQKIIRNKTMTLTKRDLVVRISEETGLIQTQVFDVVQKTLDYIAEALAKGDKVELRNFGVFDVKIRKARVGRNPNKPETDVPIPARAMVKFKAGKEMRAEVLKLTPGAK